MNFKRVGIFLSGLLLIGGVSGCMNKSGEKEILNYLEEKYNEEFVIDNYKSANKLVNQYGGDEAIVHLKENENLVFNAGTVDSKEGGYYDNYMLVKLASELEDDFNDIVNKNISSNSDYRIVLYSSAEDNYEEIKDMSAKEYINYKKDNIRISLELGIEVKNVEDIKKNYQGIYNIYKELKAYNTKRYNMSIGFVENINDEEIQEYLRVISAVQMTWKDINSKVYGEMFPTYIDDIKSVDDLNDLYIEIGD